MTSIVVIPSTRGVNEDFLSSIPLDVPVLVVDDSNGNVSKTGWSRNILVFDDEEQKRYNQKVFDLVAHRTPACKGFGYFYAYHEGFDVVISLDDDCDTRCRPDFMSHVKVGKVSRYGMIAPSGKWFNTCRLLEHEDGSPHSLIARGFPYELRDEAWRGGLVSGERAVTPVFNEGLWTGQPDVCGVDKIDADETFGDYRITKSVVLGEGTYCPLSIMNVQFTRDCVPAFWQPRDFAMPQGFKIRRHDDVWSMYILKRVLDFTRSGYVTVGEPLVKHVKKGDLLKEVKNEHYTNFVQLWFFLAVDYAIREVRNMVTIPDVTFEVAAKMLSKGVSVPHMPDLCKSVIKQYAKDVLQWVDLLR